MGNKVKLYDEFLNEEKSFIFKAADRENWKELTILVNKNNLDVDIETDFTFLTQDEDEFKKLKELIDDNDIKGLVKESKINEDEEDFDKILNDGNRVFDFLINSDSDPRDLKGKAKILYHANERFYGCWDSFCNTISNQTKLSKKDIDDLVEHLIEYWGLHS